MVDCLAAPATLFSGCTILAAGKYHNKVDIPAVAVQKDVLSAYHVLC